MGPDSKEDIQVANKHKKRFSTSLIIRERRYHFTLGKMAIIKKKKNETPK